LYAWSVTAARWAAMVCDQGLLKEDLPIMSRARQGRFAFRIVISLLGFFSLAFAGGVLACSTGAWDGGETGNGIQAGDVPTDNHEVYEATCSLGVTPDGSPNFVQDNSPDAESFFVARFYTFLDDFLPGNGVAVPVYEAHSTGSGLQFTVLVEGTADLDIFNFIVDDGVQSPTSTALDLNSPVSTNWAMVEVVWDVSGTSLDIRVNGEQGNGLTGIGSPVAIDFVRLGAMGSQTTIGVLYHDIYASRRNSLQTGGFVNHIGFELPGDANMSGSVNITDLSVTAVFVFTGYHGPSDCNQDGDTNITDLSCVANDIF